MNKNHINIIDGFRGIAILLVIFQHCYIGVYGKILEITTQLTYPYIMDQAWIGVNLFFILSGFVLALPYFRNQRDFNKPQDLIKYFKHRFIRLFPLLILINTLLLIIYYFWQGKNYVTSYFLSISTLSMFTNTHFFPDINPPTWSLSLEIWFSILFPIIFFGYRKINISFITISICLISLCIRYMGYNYEFTNNHINPVKDSLLARIDDFAIGIYLCYLYSKNKLPELKYKGIIIGILFLFIAALGWDLVAQGKLYLFQIFLNNITQFGFVLIFIGSIQIEKSKWNILNFYPLRLLGAMCYSIYLWHMFFAKELILENPTLIINELLFWSLLLFSSFITYSFIEFPKKSFKELLLIK